jgi:sugar fermentation stimulation protein A
MRFSQSLIRGRLIRRYQRFLADVELQPGEVVTAHSANTGSMLGCAHPGSPVWLSLSDNQRRKYPYTWELVEAVPGVVVGINTMLSNPLVQEAIDNGVIRELQGYAKIRREVLYGSERSRIDLLLEGHTALPPCYVEVKNVTMAQGAVGMFPDAVTTRGTRHLRELLSMARQGARAVLCFCVQRRDVNEIRPADHIDARYGETLRQAIAGGVEVLAYQADPTPCEIALIRSLPVVIPS